MNNILDTHKIELDAIKLFVYTVNEFKRFSQVLEKHQITDSYDETSYTQINIKLMLLRKYGNCSDKVYIEKVIQSSIKKYPQHRGKLNKILLKYNNIENQQLEYILPDGMKLNLYKTIEDVMYGLYLHADENRIKRLMQTSENLRFVCVRKYVEELEDVVIKLYDFLVELGETVETKVPEKATIIYLGDPSENRQEIKKTSYWSNLYGRDGNEEELEDKLRNKNLEELTILLTCLTFINGLKDEKNLPSFFNALIYPSTKKDWGDYSEARKLYNSISKPGISEIVRFNKDHTMAYVRIMPHVDNVFFINTPHVIEDFCEISLVKDRENQWKIFSMGSHLDSCIMK